MESFSLLKYWRSSGGPTPAVSTIPTSDKSSSADDDGPFFDLEFALPEQDDEATEEEQNEVVLSTSEEEEEEEDREFNFTLSSGSSNENADNNLTLSPSDDLFFKGKLVPVISGSESESKPQFSLFKSATKLRVLMLRFKKMKAEQSPPGGLDEIDGSTDTSNIAVSQDEGSNKSEIPQTTPIEQKKLFTVKFKVEEIPMLSLFKDNSKSNTKTKSGSNNNSSNNEDSVSDSVSVSVMNKYLKKVKPLYIRVSKRYGEKLKFSTAASSPPPVAEVEVEEKGEVAAAAGKTGPKQGNIPAGLRVVCKHLGKSRSASSAAVAAAPTTATVSKRRDDSLLQQQDGIQSAILHCKRSFNDSRDNESLLLSRSVSDPSYEKSIGFSGKKQGEGKSSEENPKKAGNMV